MIKLFKNKKMLIVIMSAFIFLIGILCLLYERYKDEQVQNIIQDVSVDGDGVVSGIVSGIDPESGDTSSEDEKTQVNSEAIKLEENENDVIYVHIIGEVNNTGVLKLTKGQRIVDAVELAGGTTQLADLSRVNLAYVLSDGQQINIPSIYDENKDFQYITESSGDGVISGSEDVAKGNNNDVKVNINTASQSELEILNGIGPSLANRIIEYRKKNGEFKSAEELKNVTGIGEAKYDGLKDSVVVK